jgi:pimeloyl-ACP methyl ester carboxylesterase
VPSIAVDLPGHGLSAPVPTGYLLPGQPGFATERSVLADLSMDQMADELVTRLAEVRPRFRRVLLVAHSAGGGPASAAAERAPELVDHLVYLSAFVPAGRPRFVDYVDAPENAGAVHVPRVGDPAAIGAIRINPLSADPAEVSVIHSSFLADWPVDQPGWQMLLHPDEPIASLTAPVQVTASRWGRIPRAFIRLTDDLALPVVTQDLMIAEADQVAPDRKTEVHSLPGSHSPFLTRPDELATLLVSFANRS